MGFIEETVGGHQHEMRPKEEIAEFEGPDGGCVEEPSGDHLEDDESCEREDEVAENLSNPVADRVDSFGNSYPLIFSHLRISSLCNRLKDCQDSAVPHIGALLQTGEVRNRERVSSMSKRFLLVPDGPKIF